MNQKELMQFAIKGMEAEIREHERHVRKCTDLINLKREGKKVNTKFTLKELEDKRASHLKEIKRISDLQFDLEFDLNEME